MDPIKQIAPAERKIWRAGTLTYTAGALGMLCFWLLWGDFTWAMKDRAVGPAATLLIKEIGVSEFLYGLIIVGFPNFTNTFLSPIISYLSDRHRGRWGRRIPFLLFTTPFIVLGLYGLGCTRLFASLLHQAVPSIPLHAAQLIFFCLAWVSLDFGTTLASSLFNALVNDVVPRELLGRFFALFRLVSLGAGMLFNFWLIGKVQEYTLEIFLGIGTLYGAGLLMLCWKVREGEYPPPAASPVKRTGGGDSLFRRGSRAAATYLRQSFSLAYYRWYMAASAVAMLAFAPINMFSIQYAQQLQIPMEQYGIYLVITYTCSLVLSYPLGILADRFHPLRSGLVSLIAYLLLMAAGYRLLLDAGYFGIVFILHGVVSGCYFTLSASLGSRLLLGELFAQFCSAGGIVTAILNMVLGPLIGKLIDLSNYNYRCVFLLGGAISLIAVLLFLKLLVCYRRYGGDEAYSPPLPD